MDKERIKNIIEAALLAAGRPLTLRDLLNLFAEPDGVDRSQLRAALSELALNCESRAIALMEVAGGWRLQVKQELAPYISKLFDERPGRYSRALLETLALIAYRQPITRGDIEAVRGVGISASVFKTLQERDWVKVVGHREVPGRPALYATTRAFLDHFNLKTLDELPAIEALKIQQDILLFQPEDSAASAMPVPEDMSNIPAVFADAAGDPVPEPH